MDESEITQTPPPTLAILCDDDLSTDHECSDIEGELSRIEVRNLFGCHHTTMSD